MKQDLNHQERLQSTFFYALQFGQVSALREAIRQGANPHALYQEEPITAWDFAIRNTPLAHMREVFCVLEEQGVARHQPAAQGSHPCLTLALYTNRALAGEFTWDLWFRMDQEERRQVLLELETWWDNKAHPDPGWSRNRLRFIWSRPMSLQSLCTTDFNHYWHTARALLAHSCPLSSKVTESEKALLTEENLLWCLSGLHLDRTHPPSSALEHDFGRMFLAAPEVLVKRCLEKGEPRRLVMEILERAVHHITQEGSLEWHQQHPTLEARCLKLTQQWHAHGVHWPHDWPDSVREALSKVPVVRCFWERYVLTRALENEGDAPPLSSLRARL